MPSRRTTLLALSLAAGLWGSTLLLPPAGRPPFPARAPLAIAQNEDTDLQQLLQENEQLAALEAYKDSEALLRIKLANLRAINESRRQAGLPPLQLDLLASRVGNKHCVDMVSRGFMGHWSSNGEKPYHRYSFAGGRDHVSENVFSSWDTRGFPDIEQAMLKGHQEFMAERPPNDGHRRNILEPYHTHVGLGVALKGGQFRYCQEFIDRYVQLEPLETRVQADSTVVFKGKTLSDRYGPYAMLVYYEPMPQPLSNPKRQPGAYGDYTDVHFASVSPWEMKYNPQDHSFQVSLKLKNARPGSYYCMLYVRENPSAIPYRGGGGWNTEEGIPATSIVLVVE